MAILIPEIPNCSSCRIQRKSQAYTSRTAPRDYAAITYGRHTSTNLSITCSTSPVYFGFWDLPPTRRGNRMPNSPTIGEGSCAECMPLLLKAPFTCGPPALLISSTKTSRKSRPSESHNALFNAKSGQKRGITLIHSNILSTMKHLMDGEL